MTDVTNTPAGRNPAAPNPWEGPMLLSLSAAAELPTLRNLLQAGRERPDLYRPVNGRGFYAVRNDGAVVECFFGPRGGARRVVVGRVAGAAR